MVIYSPTSEKPRRTNRVRSFLRLLNVSSQLYTFSCLYLLEKKCTRLKNCWLVLCSMFKTVNDLSFRVLSRWSTDRHVVRTRPQPCSISCSKNMAAKLRTAQAVKRCDRFIITGKSVLYFKSSGKVKSKWPICGRLWISILSIWLKIKVIVCLYNDRGMK